jgi:hypothetical protein
MTSIIKVDNLQNQCGVNIISESSNTITIGASGDTVTLAAGASQSGFGRSGSVNWDTTPKTTGFTAVSGNGYFCDTTSAAFTVTLPAGPNAGDIVAIADYNGTAGTNAITVGRNSSNINGTASNFIISINYAAISFVYVDATAGWRSVDTSNITNVQTTFIAATGGTIATCGDYKIHTFTGPGTFTVTNAGTAAGSNSVEYLVVAGGGGGGSPGGSGGAGGGGAGGFRQNFPSPTTAGLPVSVQGYPITVGGGGPGGVPVPCTGAAGVNGNPSIFSTITSTGGGGGGGQGNSPTSTGNSGGSGGGGGYGPSTFGSGNTPPVSPSQGNNGGSVPGQSRASAGGGGAGAVGGNGPGSSGYPTGSDPAGAGGAGSANSISGSPVTYAGGGGGSVYAGTVGAGGSGGGGAGGNPPGGTGVAGTTNTGGGGGSGGAVSAGTGGTGGSGIVVIRYKFQ